jgi:hypothetical protein
MSKSNKKLHILFHRPTPWASNIHCSTKIFTKYFSNQGFQVSYLESPLDIGHLIKYSDYINVWKAAPRIENDIWVINPFCLIPFRDQRPFRSYRAAELSYRSCLPSIKNLLAKGKRNEPNIIWAAKPGSSVLKKIFPKALLIMQVVDYYPAFRGDYIKSIEKQDYEAADHIFLIGHAMTPYLTETLGIPHKKITVLGQGVHLDKYQHPLLTPNHLKDLPSPRAIWVGVLKKCDEELFCAAAKHLNSLGGSLVLIGPPSDWARKLSDEKQNVTLLNAVSPDKVPAYLMNCDIGLMLYDRKKESVYKGQNPLKLYQYAAAGLAIISTPHQEYKSLNPPIIITSSADEIPAAIDKAIREKESLREQTLSFAENHSWEKIGQLAQKNIMHSLKTKAS